MTFSNKKKDRGGFAPENKRKIKRLTEVLLRSSIAIAFGSCYYLFLLAES